MQTLRLSYSLLNAWKWGRKEDCVKIYLRLPMTFPPEQQARIDKGRAFDKYVEEFANKFKKLPPELGSLELTAPMPKLKLVEQYREGIELSGELDIWAKPLAIEIKHSESMDSSEYSETEQLDMYFLLFKLWGERTGNDSGCIGGIFYRYDPIHKDYDRTIIKNSARRIARITKMIDEYEPQIRSYFEEKQII